MDQLLTTPFTDLYLDNQTETPLGTTGSSPGSKWSLHGQVMFPATMMVTFLGMLGNCAVFQLLCLFPRNSPYTLYILTLVVTDTLNFCCKLVILLEEILEGYHLVALHVTPFLEPVSSFLDHVGLCLLAALSVEITLCTFFPTWFQHHRPKSTSASVCALTWGLSFSLHVGKKVCGDFEDHLKCQWLMQVFVGFHLLVCGVMFLSFVALSFQGLLRRPRCRCSARTHQVVLITVATFLLWGFFVLMIVCLAVQEYLCVTFDLLHLLSSVINAAHPIIYFLAGCLESGESRMSLKEVFMWFKQSDMELEKSGHTHEGCVDASSELETTDRLSSSQQTWTLASHP
ncbi:PREDICTED: mas-related G-protein coupled receptor MRG-like [Elephantulus edwardii]|uniref:mas-related G-protein coupled receptor MRG-like n=1 Tax=Elephantulus edwardii TaxID=28737 RepID=UPI0003F06C53|nr:PREDICTED: mas-related G-protein coupled receptor MRG-like [Elephantulus edwardii]